VEIEVITRDTALQVSRIYPMKLMSIAMRPLAMPPFPVEKIQEMTALMAGDGKLADNR